MKQQNARVFISYSQQDTEKVNEIKQYLQNHDFFIWIDHDRLHPGNPDWRKSIDQGIQSIDVLVYVASPEAIQSDAVRYELNSAYDKEKPIIAFWIQGESWAQVAPFSIYGSQYIDARKEQFTQSLSRLVAVLANPHLINKMSLTRKARWYTIPPSVSAMAFAVFGEMVGPGALGIVSQYTPPIDHSHFWGGCLGFIIGSIYGAGISVNTKPDIENKTTVRLQRQGIGTVIGATIGAVGVASLGYIHGMNLVSIANDDGNFIFVGIGGFLGTRIESAIRSIRNKRAAFFKMEQQSPSNNTYV